MLAWIKIALRNLAKNRRRSIITSLAVAMGFAAVNIFGGFTEYMYTGNREVAIFDKCGGHLTIFKKGFLEGGQLDPSKYIISKNEIEAVKKICRGYEDVVLVTPQLQINGLLSNGNVSTIFVAMGLVPSTIDIFLDQSTMPEFKLSIDGKQLEDDNIYGVGVTRGLANILNLNLNSNAVAFTTTVDGQMNALDVDVFFLFDTDSDEMNDKVMQVPLGLAQALYNTDGADRLAVLLGKTESTEWMRNELQKKLIQLKLDLEVKTWVEMSQWYRKVKEMFDVIFIFLFLIVFVIVVISIVNTMSMSVIERTREIGTLRAIGLKRWGVVRLFALESVFLGIIGTIIGFIFTCLTWWGIELFRPTWVPPNITTRIAIKVEFVPEIMALSFVFLIVLCLIASLIPARRAAFQNIFDALGHV